MRHPVRLAALGLAVALLAPATAAAHEHASTAAVRQHAKAADRALDKTAARVRAGNDLGAERSLGTHRRQLRAARREATRLRRSARRGGSVRRAVAADQTVANLASNCVLTLSPVVPQAGGAVQLDLAQAIASCVAVHQAVIDALHQLLTVVPQPARPLIAEAIAALSTGGLGQVTAIGGALGTPGVPPQVADVLTQALQLVTQAIDLATDQLAGIVPLLPPIAQPIVQQALDLVSAQLHQVTTLLNDLLGGLLGGAPPGTGSPPSPGGGFSIWGLLNSILGMVLPH